MSKPIPTETVVAFREFCKETLENHQGYFTLGDFEPLEECGSDGEPLWEFHAKGHTPDSYDIFELFRSLDEYEIEIHGHDEFYVARRA
jgi:hypothetical protein